MDSITIYPKDEEQKNLLRALLEEMKVRYEIISKDGQLTEEEFFAKIDKSISQANQGKTKILSKDEQKEFLGI